MLLGEAHVGEDVLLGLVEQGGELGQLGPDLVGDLAPLGLGGVGMVLGEGGGDERRDDAPAALAGMGERVAHEVHPGAVEEVGGGGASARDQAVADRKSIPRQRARWGDGGLVLAARAMHMAQNVARRAAASRLRLIAAAVR